MKSQSIGPQGPEQNCASPERTGHMREFCVEQQAGQRLDQALEALLPHMGIRGRKRCIEKGLVLVNGRAAPASRRLREGDRVSLLEAETQAAASTTASAPNLEAGSSSGEISTISDACSIADALGLRMLAMRNGYCFFSKPAHMHSASLAGSSEPSVEALAPALVRRWVEHGCGAAASGPAASGSAVFGAVPSKHAARMSAAFGAAVSGQAAFDAAAFAKLDAYGKGETRAHDELMLLQRLDYGTSGLLCAALTPEAAAAFRAAEAEGHCEKRYVALLTGVLSGPVTARQALNANGRRKTRLRDAQAHKTRYTDFWPLHVWHPGEAESEALGALLAHTISGANCGDAAGMHAASGSQLAGGAGSAQRQPLHIPPQGLTLAACRIRRGARHQIRIHAAGLGHALWGDTLYAGQEDMLPPSEEDSIQQPLMPGFFLHHGGLRLPGIACVDDVCWALPDSLVGLVHTWFAGVLTARTNAIS